MDYKSILEEQIREMQKVQNALVKEITSRNDIEDLTVASTKVAETIKDLVSFCEGHEY